MNIVNGQILDTERRILMLRGVNLGGSSKIPFGPDGWGLEPESLENPADISFAGRPFPLEEAESHFERLKKAGMSFLRFVITWESLEHAGPGLYDEAFLAYLRKILIIAAEKGISVFIDPHQDVWSRWTGGDGAPAWTLERLGMRLDRLDSTGAAVTRQYYSKFHNGEPYPRMVWPSNYNRYATATMFSLFFGGKTYAPNLKIEGENIQDWLQNHYINAFRHCFRRLKNCTAIAGWGVINEPHNGFIGHHNLEQAENPMLPTGTRISPWNAIQSASGYAVKAPVYNSIGLKTLQHEIINPDRQSLFNDGFSCPWKQAGVWTDKTGEPQLLRKDYFAGNFMKDFHKPFTLRFIEEMKEADEHTFFFIEGTAPGSNAAHHPEWSVNDPPNAINAFHWYDGFALFTKQFWPWFTINPENSRFIFGKKRVLAHFTKCLAQGVAWARARMNAMPCLLGEFGLAFDMNKRRAFSTGDYSLHEEALSMYYDAVDANLLHSTIWNYTADNSNIHGDNWNDEDLSIYSEGKERAIAGWKRPYPMATAGVPLLIKWNCEKNIFHFRFNADSAINAPTEIYLPAEFFGPQTKVETSLRYELKLEEQRLFIYNDGFGGEAELTVIF